MSYGMSLTVDREFDQTVIDVREALSEQGFGIISEIDMSGTLKEKLGVEIERQVILGACNPGFAHRALKEDPSIGLLLPCNVVVRTEGDKTTVEMLDPETMVKVTGRIEMQEIADEVSKLLSAALRSLQTK
jgi:uncharacterized protein (DUF302 family)